MTADEIRATWTALYKKWKPLRNRTGEDREWLFIKEFEAFLFAISDAEKAAQNLVKQGLDLDRYRSETQAQLGSMASDHRFSSE